MHDMYDFMKNMFMHSFSSLVTSYERTRDKKTYDNIQRILMLCYEEDEELWEIFNYAFENYMKSKEKLEEDK